jgi:hypothetical protein
MKRRLFVVALALVGWQVCLVARAELAFDEKTMMDISDIRPGMQAVGKTVFSGVKISEFHLQIIDVMPKGLYNGDLILARVLDGPVVERQSAILAGMSGSPVYINGRLIGAISIGYLFSKEPLAGITSIRDMLGAGSFLTQRADLPVPSVNRWQTSRPLTLEGKTYTALQVAAPGAAVPAGTLPMRSVALKLCCRGVGPQTLALLNERFGPLGLEAVASGGYQGSTDVSVELEPGSAVGVAFVDGDIDISGGGTITYRDGDTVLAFGHPLMKLGRVAIPLTTSWVHDFVPTYNDSFKLMTPIRQVGTLVADTPWAICGKVGLQAPMVPAQIDITDQTRHLTRHFNVRVLRQSGITPLALGGAISAAMENVYNPGYEGMVRTTYEVEGERGAHVTRSNVSYVTGSPNKAALGEILDVMQVMEDNRWQPQNIKRVTFKAELSDQDETAVIERVYAEESIAKAGKLLHLHVLVRPDDGQLIDHPVTLQMPLDLPKGAIRIAIGGGGDALTLRSRLGLLMPEFSNLNSLLAFFEKLEDNRQLCVIAALPGSGLQVDGTRLMRLPQSISSVMEASQRTDVTRGKEELSVSLPLSWVVMGRELMVMNTEDRQGAKGETPPAPASKAATDGKATDEEDADAVMPQLPRLWWAAGCLKSSRATTPPTTGGTPAPAKPATSAPAAPKIGAAAPGKEADGKQDSDETKNETATEAPKPVLRQPSIWTQSKGSEFLRGEAKGTTIRTDGGVSLAPAVTTLSDLPESYVWGALSTSNGTYFATGGPGNIYRLKSDGKPEKVFDTGAFATRGLAVDSTGNLYVGTWPGGKIFKVTPDGKGSLFAELPTEYVWSLVWSAQIGLLAGTGPEGKIYRVTPAGEVSEWLDLPQAHVLSMLAVGDALYLGTAGKGIVYRFGVDRRLEALLDVGTDDITSLCVDVTGTVYAGVAPSGKVYGLGKNGQPVALFDEKSMPVGSVVAVSGTVYAATGGEGRLVSMLQGGTYEVLHHSEVATHLLCLAADANGNVLAGTANGGKIQRFAPGNASSGTFASTVLDAKFGARWGLIDWQADVPAGAELVVRTRSGNSDNPDDGSWSSWSRAYTKPGQDRVDSPVGRYLQYQLEMKRPQGSGAGPLVRRVSIAYLPANQKPKVEISAPTLEKPVRGKVDIKWTATDPDKDQLLATVEYRAGDAKDWTLIKQVSGDKKTAEWDTSKLKDGVYDLRVTVSDELSNPGDALTDLNLLRGVWVDNTKPGTIVWQRQEAKDGRLWLDGVASDNLRLAEVVYKTDDTWHAAQPKDGMFDNQAEFFSFSVPLGKEGAAQVEVQVRDTAGNVLTEKVVWPLKTEPPKERPKD